MKLISYERGLQVRTRTLVLIALALLLALKATELWADDKQVPVPVYSPQGSGWYVVTPVPAGGYNVQRSDGSGAMVRPVGNGSYSVYEWDYDDDD